ncbi:MAG: hypothetical protein R3B84_22490 [Zavarzinella sp.]
MHVFIYYFSKLGVPRDDLESAIEDFLGSRGEVTGGGGGATGGNIDIEIESEDAEQVIDELREFLRSMTMPLDTIFDVEGRRKNLYDKP